MSFDDYFFARPSVLEGFGRILDFQGELHPFDLPVTSENFDQAAMWSDWVIVGEEIRSATVRLNEQSALESRGVGRE